MSTRSQKDTAIPFVAGTTRQMSGTGPARIANDRLDEHLKSGVNQELEAEIDFESMKLFAVPTTHHAGGRITSPIFFCM